MESSNSFSIDKKADRKHINFLEKELQLINQSCIEIIWDCYRGIAKFLEDRQTSQILTKKCTASHAWSLNETFIGLEGGGALIWAGCFCRAQLRGELPGNRWRGSALLSIELPSLTANGYVEMRNFADEGGQESRWNSDQQKICFLIYIWLRCEILI